MSNLSSAADDVLGHNGNGPAFRAQGTEQGGDTPDVNRPPHQELPEIGRDLPDVGPDPGAPPFTGEDLEDAGKPNRRKRPQDEPSN